MLRTFCQWHSRANPMRFPYPTATLSCRRSPAQTLLCTLYRDSEPHSSLCLTSASFCVLKQPACELSTHMLCRCHYVMQRLHARLLLHVIYPTTSQAGWALCAHPTRSSATGWQAACACSPQALHLVSLVSHACIHSLAPGQVGRVLDTAAGWAAAGRLAGGGQRAPARAYPHPPPCHPDAPARAYPTLPNRGYAR